MSIETFSFPEAGTIGKIEDALLAGGYVRVANNPFHPGPTGTRHYSWWDSRDFRSASGIDGSAYPLDDEGKRESGTSSDWAIRLRTSMWASTFDKEHQNETVRTLKRAFGGFFENDHFGRNRYIPINRPLSTAVTRGLYALRDRVIADLEALEHTIPEEQIQSVSTRVGRVTETNVDLELLETVRRLWWKPPSLQRTCAVRRRIA